MIYNKEATFPYPVLTNGTENYKQGEFILDVELMENAFVYKFNISYDIGSSFLSELVQTDMAELIFVVQSKDNKFYLLDRNQKEIYIPKNRISFNKRTSLQLLIRANKEISFMNNMDLNEFYDDKKSEIIVHEHAVLGLSNIVIFDGSNKKPFELFEKKLDPNIKSDIAIELGEETIVIVYRNENFQFNSYPNSVSLNYPYVYMGLQKALLKMIMENSDDQDSLMIREMDPPNNGLSFKLYNLMKSKFVEELSVDNIDQVINSISDHMIEKFVHTIKGISDNGN